MTLLSTPLNKEERPVTIRGYHFHRDLKKSNRHHHDHHYLYLYHHHCHHMDKSHHDFLAWTGWMDSYILMLWLMPLLKFIVFIYI